MSETEGLLADAQVQSDDNQQQQEESISHIEPTNEQPVDNVTVAKEDEEVDVVRPEWYPEKFWGDDGPDIENLVKSYTELQKKFSQGKHKAPEKYDDSVFKSANIPDDDPLYSTYRDWAKENGISQDAFESLASKFVEIVGSQNESAKVAYEQEYKKLGPNADVTIKSMTDWAQGLVRKGVWSPDDFEEFKIMGGTAQGIRALQKIRSYYGDQPVPVDVAPVGDTPSKEELMAMVGKPEYATDPGYRAKVEKLFEKVYGTKEYSPF